MTKYDVIIIGAGPAGLFAAIELGYQAKRVLLLEKNNMAGKKLLLSGAGQCNITQAGNILDFSNHYGDGYKYIKRALESFTNEDTVNFFENRGLKMEVLENGKIFPKTRSASDVLGLLLKECAKYKVDIHYSEKANEISLAEEGYTVETNKQTYNSKIVIISTGGMSYPKTGSAGDGYELGAALGHQIVEPHPALTPVEIKNFPFASLAGISLENVPITIWRDGKKMKECVGDLLFTHKGLSGPGILNNSRWMKEKDMLCINFMKANNIPAFHKAILKDIDDHGKDMVKTILRKYNLPKRLLEALLKDINIDEETQCARIKKETRNLLVKALVEYPLTISKMGGFHIAMVTSGGIHMKQVNPTTMESRINKNLYFIGEVLDIDGDTGGYNIQAALSTAKLCANGIKRKEQK